MAAVNTASAKNTIFPASEKKPPSVDVPVDGAVGTAAVVVVVVVVVIDRTNISTVAVPARGGVPPSVAVTVSVYVVPAATPDKST